MINLKLANANPRLIYLRIDYNRSFGPETRIQQRRFNTTSTISLNINHLEKKIEKKTSNRLWCSWMKRLTNDTVKPISIIYRRIIKKKTHNSVDYIESKWRFGEETMLIHWFLLFAVYLFLLLFYLEAFQMEKSINQNSIRHWESDSCASSINVPHEWNIAHPTINIVRIIFYVFFPTRKKSIMLKTSNDKLFRSLIDTCLTHWSLSLDSY